MGLTNHLQVLGWSYPTAFQGSRKFAEIGNKEITTTRPPGKLTGRWLENGPGLKRCFPVENGDIPASYVSLAEG